MGKGSKKKNKVILPPQLPPEVDDDEVVVSDEDVEFFRGNDEHARFIARLDRKSIDSYVTWVADHDEDEVERLYEEAAAALKPRKEGEVDRVDALPVKTLQGELVYNTAKRARSADNANGVESTYEDKAADTKQSIQKEQKGKMENPKTKREIVNCKMCKLKVKFRRESYTQKCWKRSRKNFQLSNCSRKRRLNWLK